MTFLDPGDHAESGNSMPFWIRFDTPVDRKLEQVIKEKISTMLGIGSTMPEPNQQWGYKFVDGYFTLMFRTATDRDLARFAI